MMEGPGAVAIVRVAHVIAELDKLVGCLVSPGYTAGRRRPHHRAAAARERRQLPCLGVLGDVDTELHAVFTSRGRRRSCQA